MSPTRRYPAEAVSPADEAWEIIRELVLDNERRREVSDALGMSFARAKALRRIYKAPSTMGELATTLGIDPPYMTIVVDDLERQGLVDAQAPPHRPPGQAGGSHRPGQRGGAAGPGHIEPPAGRAHGAARSRIGGAVARAAGSPARSGGRRDRLAQGVSPPPKRWCRRRRGLERRRRGRQMRASGSEPDHA